MKSFRKLDTYMLKNHPSLWILGIHIFIPGLILALLLLILLGYALPIYPDLKAQSYRNNFFILRLLVTLVTIAFAILFVVRQVRFNSKRIHHHLPYSYGFGYFLVFFITFLGISSLPLAPTFGGWLHAKQEISVKGNLASTESYDEYGKYLYSYETTLGTGSQYSHDFAEDVNEFESIFRYISSGFWEFYVYYSLILAVVLFILCAADKRDFGWGMLVSALLPAVFGIFAGVISLVIQDFDEDLVIALLTIFSLVSIALAFMRFERRSALNKAFGIAVHLYLPLVALVYTFYFYEKNHMDIENIGHVVAVSSIVLGMIIFNRYYKDRYVNPG